MIKTILAGSLAVAMGVGAIVGLTELAYRSYQHYAPRYEAVRRDTFEQSRAYQEGTIRDLENLHLDYARGTPASREAIASVAAHRLADVDPEILTPELRQWRDELRSAQ